MEGQSSVVQSYLIHQTPETEVRAQVIQITGISYIGMQRTYLSDPESKERSKGLYLPVEAWEKFAKETIPLLKIEQTNQTKSRKRKNKSRLGMIKLYKSFMYYDIVLYVFLICFTMFKSLYFFYVL